MKVKVPEYFTEFKCIADKCRDSCCIGWEIDVDEVARQKYEALGGALGQEIVEKTSHGCFPLMENGRCAFLDEVGLCRIISALGDGYLCDICREHPRYYGVGNGIIEGGLGLGCEEAARIILEIKKAPKLIEIEKEISYSDEDDYPELSEEIRERLYGIVFTEEINTVAKTYAAYSALADDLSFKIVSGGDVKSVPEVSLEPFTKEVVEELYSGVLDSIEECEALSDGWCELVDKVRGVDVDTVLKKLDEMRGILYYFTHRYVREGVEDMSLYARIIFALTSAMTVAALSVIMDCDTPEIRAAVEYSKNIEYSTENVDYILEEIC